jgi:MFS family permease
MKPSPWLIGKLWKGRHNLFCGGSIGRYFGRKRFLLTCVGIFTVASALCGMATSLPMLVLARIIQGAAGGALQPTASNKPQQTIRQTSNERQPLLSWTLN